MRARFWLCAAWLGACDLFIARDKHATAGSGARALENGAKKPGTTESRDSLGRELEQILAALGAVAKHLLQHVPARGTSEYTEMVMLLA